VVYERAGERGGPEAIVVDQQHETHLARPWQAVLGNLLHAAMALGAPELVDDDERATLSAAWNASRFPA
jgi:hypothetical protein